MNELDAIRQVLMLHMNKRPSLSQVAPQQLLSVFVALCV